MLGPLGFEDVLTHWSRMGRDHPEHPALAPDREADLCKTIPMGFHGDDVADLEDAYSGALLHTLHIWGATSFRL